MHPHEPCSHCSSPYRSLGDCPHWGQFSNFSNEQLNTSFFSPGFELNSNFYNPDWSNHSDFSRHDHATENFAPQIDELHHHEYPQFDNHFSSHSSFDYPPQQSSLEETFKDFKVLIGQPTIPAPQEPSLEDTLEAFRQTVNQPCHELIDALVAKTEAIARSEGQLGQLVAEFNRVEDDELSQEMARGQDIIDEDTPSNSLHEHAQTTTKFGSELSLEDPKMECFTPDDCDLDLDRLVMQDGVLHDLSLEDPEMEHIAPDRDDLDLDRLLDYADIFSEPSLEDSSGECFDQIDYDPDLDKFLKQAVMFSEPSLEDPLEESFAQFDFDLDLDMVHEQAKALLDPTPELRTENGEEAKEEHLEQIEPPPISNWSNDKEVSTEAHSHITIPLETQQASSFQCLEEPSYVEIFEDSCSQNHKSRNHVPKWIPRNYDNYIRWQNILPEGYQVLKKKGWKGLVGHPYERGRCGIFPFFIFRTAFFIYFLSCHFIFVLFCF